MHAKPGLRVFFNIQITRSRLGDLKRYVAWVNMNSFRQAHWFAKSFGFLVGLAYLFSCLGRSGPILSDNIALDRICEFEFGYADPLHWLLTIFLELPQFLLFIFGSIFVVQMVIFSASKNCKFSLSMSFRLVFAFAIYTAILTTEWVIYNERTNSELYGFVDYSSPVWLIEGAYFSKYILNAGLFCSAYWLVYTIWDRIDRTSKQTVNIAT